MPNIQENIPLKPLTTFEIGGMAQFYVEVQDEEQLKDALDWAHREDVPVFILAGGSNVLVDDEGFDGLVIHIKMQNHSFDGPILTAEAGCPLLDLIEAGSKHILGGWEKLAGIPGSLGGAVRGNAGAFGTEIQDVIENVDVLHRHTFEKRTLTNAECMFAYRSSYFKKNPEWIILAARIRLIEKDQKEIISAIAETIHQRELRHLQNVRAAGSYFMNPVSPESVIKQFETEKNTSAREGRVPAGWLIEKVGMKGERVGGAIASQQHPNYLVNESGNATTKDVIMLSARIKTAVHAQFGIMLEEEVTLV